jgi:hypothetical protein
MIAESRAQSLKGQYTVLPTLPFPLTLSVDALTDCWDQRYRSVLLGWANGESSNPLQPATGLSQGLNLLCMKLTASRSHYLRAARFSEEGHPVQRFCNLTLGVLFAVVCIV